MELLDKINWDNLTNSEIELKQLVMKEEYESLKNNISILMDKLDLLDIEYEKSKKILNKRYNIRK